MLHVFNPAAKDGANPQAGLIEGRDGGLRLRITLPEVCS